jgi:hypothetical protein
LAKHTWDLMDDLTQEQKDKLLKAVSRILFTHETIAHIIDVELLEEGDLGELEVI